MKPLATAPGSLQKSGAYKIIRASHEVWSVGRSHPEDVTAD